MNEITIVADVIGNLVVREGKLPNARHEWQADGLSVYIRGRFSVTLYATAANLLISYCQERHIPTHTIRRVK